MGKFYPPPDLVAVGTARAPLWIWGTGIGLRWVGRPGRSGGRVRGWSKHEGVRHPGRGREGRGTGAGGSPRRRPRLRLKRGEHRPPGRARSGERSEAGCKARGRGGGGGRATEGGPEYVSRWLVPRRKAFYQRHCRKRIRTGDHDTQGVRKGRGREEPCRPSLGFPPHSGSEAAYTLQCQRRPARFQHVKRLRDTRYSGGNHPPPRSHGAAGGGIIPIPSRGMTGSGVMAG